MNIIHELVSGLTRIYIGFAISDSMFTGVTQRIERIVVSRNYIKDLLTYYPERIYVCANPSHKATFDALRCRYGIELTIPLYPTKVQLTEQDSLIVLSVTNLPRLTDRHEYTNEQIEGADFTFAQYNIIKDLADKRRGLE